MDKEKVSRLFGDEKFRKHSIYFYKEHTTKKEAADKSDISRGKVIKDLKKFIKSDKSYLKLKPGKKGKPYLLSQEILAEWISEIIGLESSETETLEDFLSTAGIEKIMRDSENWDDVVSKLVLSMIFINQPWEHGEKVEGLPPFAEQVENLSAFDHFTEEELEKYVTALQEFSREKKMTALAEKIVDSDIEISASSSDWNQLINEIARVGAAPLLDYFNRLMQSNSYQRFRKPLKKELNKTATDHGLEFDEEDLPDEIKSP